MENASLENRVRHDACREVQSALSVKHGQNTYNIISVLQDTYNTHVIQHTFSFIIRCDRLSAET